MKASDHISNLPKENATSIDSDVSLDVEKLQVSDDAMHHSFSTIFVEFFTSKAALLKLPLMYMPFCSTLMHNNLGDLQDTVTAYEMQNRFLNKEVLELNQLRQHAIDREQKLFM